MKVSSLKDVETYIYSSVIMPLKHLNVPDLGFPSPIRGEKDHEWSLMVRLAPLNREYRRNYQRTQAQRRRDWQVVLFTGKAEYVVASYNERQKWVKLYERPFKVLKAMPLMGKLYEAFYQNTPFTKVITEAEAPRVRPFIARHRHDGAVPAMEGSYDSDGYADVTEEMPF